MSFVVLLSHILLLLMLWITKDFIIINCLYAFILLHMLPFMIYFIPSYIFFSLSRKNSHCVSCSVSLLLTKSFSFILSENIFMSPSFFQKYFARYGILGWFLQMSFHCFLASIVSIRNSTINCNIGFLSGCFSDFLFGC